MVFLEILCCIFTLVSVYLLGKKHILGPLLGAFNGFVLWGLYASLIGAWFMLATNIILGALYLRAAYMWSKN